MSHETKAEQSTHPLAAVQLLDGGVDGGLEDALAAERLDHLPGAKEGGEHTIWRARTVRASAHAIHTDAGEERREKGEGEGRTNW